MSTALRFPRGTGAGRSASEVASRRSRTKGKFAVEANTAEVPTLEALADLAGDEDPRFDEDDPFHADLITDADIAAAMAPAQFTVTDAFIPTQNREQILDRIDYHQQVIDGAPADRLQVSDSGRRDLLAQFDDATQQAEINLDIAYNDLTMLDEADEPFDPSAFDYTRLSSARRDQFDAVYTRAYDAGYAAMGTPIIEDTDEAEQFAGFVGRALVEHNFDDTTFDMTEMLRDFDSERSGTLAAPFANGPKQRDWIRDMSTTDGLNTTVAVSGGYDRRATRDLEQFAAYLRSSGFVITGRRVVGPDPYRWFINGRPTVPVRA